MTDERLVARFRAGDTDAVRRLYEQFGRAVFTVGYKALGDRSLAEEVVQLTFLKAWQAADRFDPSQELAPWLYTIARRTAIDLFRREARHAPAEGEVDIVALPPSFEDLWEVWAVRSAIDRLPEAERQVVASMHYEGRTMQETAVELGVPLGTVKSRSHRAHLRLAALLDHVRRASA
ncbi:MAG: sigma-70 family RNA polymerase sigma factor [Acidimicrobiia bacterium]|nr:sigma-70 family RNA polymerase sigma factor [Acidimicrobiia bacterium]